MSLQSRLRYAPLRDKVMDAAEASKCITNGTNLFISGFTGGHPKLIPKELVRRAKAGEELKVNLYSGASTGHEVDGIFAEAGIVSIRRPWMADRTMRDKINQGKIRFKDQHLSRLGGLVRSGEWGPVDVAVVEAVAITENCGLIPSMSVGNTPSFVKNAKKIIIELSGTVPEELEGIHDIYMPDEPPYRMPIPLYRCSDRIGKPWVDFDPNKVHAVVYTEGHDTYATFGKPSAEANTIAERILDFVEHEIRKGRLPRVQPWQSGVGDVANAVLMGFTDNDFFNQIYFYSEVLQDAALDLIDIGKIRSASAAGMTLSEKARDQFWASLERYKERIVLRPVEISNSPEVVRRLGVVAINTAIEIDIYGHVNSTHVMGSQLMNGIGGSGDFERNGMLTFIVTPSIAKNGKVSTIVPMVSHVDHSEHSVDIIVTEQGLVDTRPLSPREVAEAVIKNCAHPDYRDLLMDYYQRAVKETGGHEPHLLRETFSFHTRFMETGDMRPARQTAAA